MYLRTRLFIMVWWQAYTLYLKLGLSFEWHERVQKAEIVDRKRGYIRELRNARKEFWPEIVSFALHNFTCFSWSFSRLLLITSLFHNHDIAARYTRSNTQRRPLHRFQGIEPCDFYLRLRVLFCVAGPKNPVFPPESLSRMILISVCCVSVLHGRTQTAISSWSEPQPNVLLI